MDLMDLLAGAKSMDAAVATLDSKLRSRAPSSNAASAATAPMPPPPPPPSGMKGEGAPRCRALGAVTALTAGCYCDALRVVACARAGSAGNPAVVDVRDLDGAGGFSVDAPGGGGDGAVVAAVSELDGRLLLFVARGTAVRRWIYERRGGGAWASVGAAAAAAVAEGATAIVASGASVAVLSSKAVHVLEAANLGAAATLPSTVGALRAACWTDGGSLAVAGSRGVAAWRAGGKRLEVAADAPARCLAAVPGGGFFAVADAEVKLRDDRGFEFSAAAAAPAPSAAGPLVVGAPPSLGAPRITAERSFSGFGGGAIPAGLLLAGAGPGAGAPAPSRPAPRLLKFREAAAGARLAASAPVASLPGGVVTADLVAVYGDAVGVASSFDGARSVAEFAVDDLSDRGPRRLPAPDGARLRGLAARGNGGLVALLREAPPAGACGIPAPGRAAKPADAFALDVAPVGATAAGAPAAGGGEIAALRAHVDARCDAIERKLDALLALASRK